MQKPVYYEVPEIEAFVNSQLKDNGIAKNKKKK